MTPSPDGALIRHAVAAALVGAALLLSSLVLPVAAQAEAAPVDPDVSALVERFAPVVVVRKQQEPCGPGEPYRPTTVETVLGQQGVVLRGPAGQTVSTPTAADVASKGADWYLDYPGNPLSPGCQYEEWFRKNSVGVEPTVYAHVTTEKAHPGLLAVQYWFFYTFNDWNDKHEGDWEMVQVVLPAATAGQALKAQPQRVAYAQHEGSQVSAWGDPGLVRVGDHPVVYPGEGSHAAYYGQRRWFGKSSKAGFGCDDTTPPGLEVTPRVVVIPSGAPPTSGELAWVSFTGHWGQQEPSFNNGPTGPVTKTQWLSPIGWMDSEGRPSAVSLPRVPDLALDQFCKLTAGGSLLFVDLLNHPFWVGVVVVVLLALLVLGIRRTSWRHPSVDRPDRQRHAGQIVTGGLGWVFRHVGAVAVVDAVVAAAFVLAAFTNVLVQPKPVPGDITGALEQTGWGASLVLGCLAVAVLLVLGWGAARIIALVRDDAEGRTPRVRGEAVPGSRGTSGVAASMLVLLASSALTGSLLLLPVAAWVLATYGVSPAVAVIEGVPLRASLRRSAELTQHQRWRTLVVQTMLLVIGTGVATLVGAALLLATTLPFWAVALITMGLLLVLLPAAFAGIALQYYDLRHRGTRGTVPEPATAAPA